MVTKCFQNGYKMVTYENTDVYFFLILKKYLLMLLQSYTYIKFKFNIYKVSY